MLPMERARNVRRSMAEAGLSSMCRELVADRLGNSQVSEEVPKLMLVQVVQQSLGHQAATHWLYFLDLVRGERHVLSVEAAEDRHLIIAVDLEAADGASIFRFHANVLEPFPDLRIRINDANQHGTEIVSLIVRQLGADIAAFEEELMTGGATLHKAVSYTHLTLP